MQVSVEVTNGLERRMTIQIPADQVDQQVQSKLQQLAGTVRIDGFRPGKVPMSVVVKRFGGQVREEVAGELITSSYEEALQQQQLRPVGQPAIQSMQNQQGQEFEYVAVFEVYPDVEPPDLSAVNIERLVASVADEDIDGMLKKLQKQRVTWSNVERPADNGDRVEIDFEGTIDGEAFSGNSGKNVPLELGSDTMIPGFEEKLTGVNSGETRTLDVTFPDEYGTEEVAGKSAKFEVTVNSVAEAILPELDDDFAQAFGVTDGGMESLRGDIRENMQRELDVSLQTRIRKQVFDMLLEHANVDIPAALIDSEIDALIKKDESNADTDADRSQYEEEANRRVALGLLISEIIKRNQLQVDAEKVRETIEKIAQSYEKPEEVVQWYYSNQDMMSGVQTLVMEEVVVDWVMGQVNVEDKSTNFSEIMEA